MKNKQALTDTLHKLKKQILKVEQDNIKLSEQDTRQGLINPLFKALGWDFSDFSCVRSEFRNQKSNDPVDYAFFGDKNKTKPVLLVEAKSLGTDLKNAKIIKQLCSYLGEVGVQWGVLTDGNKYVLYNSNGGYAFEDQKFLTLQITTMDTEDGIECHNLAEKLIALLNRSCLENDEIQKTYAAHVTNRHIENAMESLLTAPFDTLAAAIQQEFKQERVKVDPNLQITKEQIMDYLNFVKNEEGHIDFDTETETLRSDEHILHNIAVAQESNADVTLQNLSSGRAKRVSVLDLLKNKLCYEGDNWRLVYKGEVIWGRVTGNGEIEVDGKTYATPSGASVAVIRGKYNYSDASNKTNLLTSNGWDAWKYKDPQDKWHKIDELKKQCLKLHEHNSSTNQQKPQAA